MVKWLCAMCVVALVGAGVLSGCKSGSEEPAKKPDSGSIGKIAGGVKDRADQTVEKAGGVRAEEGKILEENQ